MRKKLYFVFILMVLAASLSAIYVEVGTGTATTNYVPIYGYYNYGWSRTIYLQSDLMYEMEINGLSYDLANAPVDYTVNNQSYYMRHTNDSIIQSNAYINPATDDSYQLVYSGSVTYNSSGWQELNLDNTFEYNGTDNLELVVINNTGQWASNYPNFLGTTATPERAVYNFADGSLPTDGGILTAIYPNIRFNFLAENEPSVATLTAPENSSFNVGAPVSLTWTNGENTDWVKIYLSTIHSEVLSMSPTALIADSYAQESYTVNTLDPLTNYYWRVVSGNDITEYLIATPVWSFVSSPADGSIVIGNGDVINTHLPMEPFYGYSITQSIYNQEWINVDDKRIEQISYYYNGNSSWTEGIQLYLGHTTSSQFTGGNSWILADEMTLVYEGPFTVPADEGWVTIPLSVPFSYNNIDNLVVGFRAATPGYHGSNDQFYASTTTEYNSISYYSDTTNSNFSSPANGGISSTIPNVLFTVSDISNTPELIVQPGAFNWDNTLINTTTDPVTFTMRNAGLSALTVNSVSIDQATDFILTDNNSYPLVITNNAPIFTVTFHPLSVGDFTATITINDSEIGDTEIEISGSGYDAMIYDFPHYEGFEGVASGSLPTEWQGIVISDNNYASVGVSSTQALAGTNSLRMYNSGDTAPELYAITPPISELTTKRIKFNAKSTTNTATLIVGVSENNHNMDSFTAIQTIELNNAYQEHFVNLNIASEDNQFIVFKSGVFNGNYQYIHIDEVAIEEMPTSPIATISPLFHDYPETIINTSAQAFFSIRNTGLGTLTVNSITLDQTVDFMIVDEDQFPLEVAAQTESIEVLFHPLTEGIFNANLTITHSGATEVVIPLTGMGIDVMLYEFPHFEGFESTATLAMPTNWASVINSGNTSVTVGVSETSSFEGTKSLRFYNAIDMTASITAITPPIDNLTSRRIRFMGKVSTLGPGVVIGTTMNNNGNIQFAARDTVYFTTNYEQYQFGFSSADENAQFIAMKYLGTDATYVSTYLDNFYIETIPTGPAIAIAQHSLDFGDLYLNRTGVAQLNVQNWGAQNLVANFSQTGTELSFLPEELTVLPSGSAEVIVTLAPISEGAYSGSFIVNSNDTNLPAITITTTANILPALPEGVSVIGIGTLTDQGLPFEPWYKHTWSQSIYYASEVGISDQRIEKISWHYNGNTAWGPDELKIYMGLTSKTQFDNDSDWVSVDQMMEVYDGNISVPSNDGLVEIELTMPFNYNTTQNLVVGVFHSAPSYHNSADEFYCTASSVTRSILYYNDSTVPDPLVPPVANYMRNSFPNITLEFGEVADAADLIVYPSTTIFEMVPVDDASAEKTVTMRSVGLQDITIATAPSLTGTDADQFSITTDDNTYPIVLPFTQTATIGITFTPTSEGSKNAIVQIVDSATRVTHTVNLSGFAYADDGNDQAAGATVLNLPVDGDTYAIMPVGDVDWYKIPSMGVGDTLMAHVEMSGGSDVDTNIWLYGPVADPVNLPGDSHIANGDNINKILVASGDYYLRIAKYNIYPSPANPHTRKNANGEFERVDRDDTGIYNLFVSANYNYAYNTPVNLQASNQAGFVELTWVEPDYERYLIGYHLYKDGSLISDEMVPIGTNLYQDSEVVVGTDYTYYAVGAYAEPSGFSAPSNTATITYFNIGEPFWGDDFEQHPDFALELPNWLQYDLDGGTTYGISDVEFDNAGEAMSYIVFNPAATTPPITDMIPQSGNKFLASFASSEGENNDWIITPRITIGETTVVSFYAKSYTSDYGLEKFKVKMSMGGDQVQDFTYTLHQGQDYLTAPIEWTPYYFNISQLAGNTARFALQCVSTNAFVLMVDNFRVDSTDDGVDNENVENIPQLDALNQNYPNPFNPETTISFSTKENGKVALDIYNIKGQKVRTLLNETKEAGNHSVVWNGKDDNGKSVASGVFFYRMKSEKYNSTKKMILMK